MLPKKTDELQCDLSDTDADEFAGCKDNFREKLSTYLGNPSKHNSCTIMIDVPHLGIENSICSQKERNSIPEKLASLNKESMSTANESPEKKLSEDEKRMSIGDEEIKIPTILPKLHELVFKAEYKLMKKLFKESKYGEKELLEELNGNPPIFLAVMLCPPEEEDSRRYKIIDLLLKFGSDPLHKNSDGWSLLEVAASIKNLYIIRKVYAYVRNWRLKIWRQKRETLYEHLAAIPDFYLEIKWDFRSCIIPFISFFTPSDTYKIWKMGSSVRLDFSFLGFNNNSSVISDTTILMREGYLVKDQFKKLDFTILDHKNKQLVNPLQTPESEELDELAKEISESPPVQGDLTISDVKWEQSKTFFGNMKIRKIHYRLAQKYKLQFDTIINTKSLKNSALNKTYEEYLECNSHSSNGKNLANDPEPIKKKVNCGMWTTKDFPLDLPQVMTVIKTLAKHNGNFKKLKEYLSNESIKDIIANNGFPVRIQIPMGCTVYAVVTFTAFKKLSPEMDDYPSIFSVPEGYNLVSRKNAFSCLGRNKETIIANLNI